ncbi:MAG: diguanylate cyclase [Pseudomonadota bacterium]
MSTENTFSDELIELEPEIHECLAHGSTFLKFPKKLETFFTALDTPKRRKRYFLLGLSAIILFDLFCIADRFMLPDVYLTAWKIRLGIVTPLMCLFLILIRIKPLYRYMDFFAGFLLLLTSASIVWFLILSQHPNVVHYHTGIILIITFGNIVVRIHFRYAFGYSAAILLLYVIGIDHVSQMPVAAAQNSSLVLITAAVISLIGNYQLEGEIRRDFLLTLLQRINTIKLEANNRKLEQLSISDELTGTANRRHFDKTFEREWSSAARNRYPLSLIFLDIDFFKSYNDNYGHQAGDQCLKKIGEALNRNIRRTHDLLARYGGEEFIILLPHTEMEEAFNLSEKIRQSIEHINIKHEFSQIANHITVSLGVASAVPTPQTDSSYLVEQADAALYQAKNNGRNQVVRYSDPV